MLRCRADRTTSARGEWDSAFVTPLQVTVTDPRTVALLFQPVLLRCHYQTVTPDPPPIVTWKYKSFCPLPPGDPGLGPSLGDTPVPSPPCPDAARTIRIVATKQGGVVTLGDFYRGRGVTILGGAELSLGPAAWGDSGVYVCTVTSTQDLEGNNEAEAELVVLGSLPEPTHLLPGVLVGTLPDWLFVVLVALGGALVAVGVGLCWCQCCPHTCCCLVRCPCCPRRCCCPEALYLAGKAATSGGMGSVYGPPVPPLALRTLASSQSSQVPLLRDSDGSVVSAPPLPPPTVLRYLEEQIGALEPRGRYPPPRAAPPPQRHQLPPRRTGLLGPPRTPPISPIPPQGALALS
ncbi:lipolysis-stimulated lipoprotein receptor-like [Falco rusticolus]|uniref:lipolysis-stimulated lipoprotein receptor-like n=1 Tax=Falco rusticolus TaxID=120794 RepID=UPI0018865C00|nr:lipolysis-stimulated lipoprotein receptor-like [Falco rusticolus]